MFVVKKLPKIALCSIFVLAKLLIGKHLARPSRSKGLLWRAWSVQFLCKIQPFSPFVRTKKLPKIVFCSVFVLDKLLLGNALITTKQVQRTPVESLVLRFLCKIQSFSLFVRTKKLLKIIFCSVFVLDKLLLGNTFTTTKQELGRYGFSAKYNFSSCLFVLKSYLKLYFAASLYLPSSCLATHLSRPSRSLVGTVSLQSTTFLAFCLY